LNSRGSRLPESQAPVGRPRSTFDLKVDRAVLNRLPPDRDSRNLIRRTSNH